MDKEIRKRLTIFSQIFRKAQEEGNITALAELGDVEIERPEACIHAPDSGAREVRFPLTRVLPLLCTNLGFGFDEHHLLGHPLQHGQHGVRLGDESQ